jgi:acetyl/propionyl-CoA carboxylase alpha subunit
VAWGEDRTAAIERLKRAIEEYSITGIETTLSFGTFVLNHPEFLAGNFDTHFIARHYDSENLALPEPEHNDRLAAAIAAAGFFNKTENTTTVQSSVSGSTGNWLKNRKQHL